MNQSVDEMLDAFWRSFPPSGDGAYTRERNRLLNFRESLGLRASNRDLLQIDSALVTLAANFGVLEDVVAFAQRVLAQQDYSSTATIATVLSLLQALHSLRRHDEELHIATSTCVQDATPPEDVLPILESIVVSHPQQVTWSEPLRQKLREALQAEALSELDQDSLAVPTEPAELDKFALMLARERRSWNERMMAKFMSRNE